MFSRRIFSQTWDKTHHDEKNIGDRFDKVESLLMQIPTLLKQDTRKNEMKHVVVVATWPLRKDCPIWEEVNVDNYPVPVVEMQHISLL